MARLRRLVCRSRPPTRCRSLRRQRRRRGMQRCPQSRLPANLARRPPLRSGPTPLRQPAGDEFLRRSRDRGIESRRRSPAGRVRSSGLCRSLLFLFPPAAGFRDLSKTSASSAASTWTPGVAPPADSSTAQATDAASPVKQRETPLPPAPPQVTEQIGQKLVSTQDVPPSSPVPAKMKESSFAPGQPDSDLGGPTAQPESALGRAPVDAFLAPRSSPAVTPPGSETGAVQSVLHRFQRAYTDLNAGVVKAVWPSVDEKTLRRAFDQLEQQDAVFDRCRIDVTGVRAVAACDGYSRYIPKVGSKTPQVVSRHWRFTLEKAASEWTIRTVEFR